jgi:hypothetical protein
MASDAFPFPDCVARSWYNGCYSGEDDKDQLSIDYCENKLAMVFTGTSF